MPPGKFLKWICAEMQSGAFETQFWEILQCVHCSGHSVWISSRKYGLWFETLQFFCSFQSVQLILIYFVEGRSSTVCSLLGPFRLDKFQKIWAVISDLAIFLPFSICSVNFDILCRGSLFHHARLYSFTFVQWNLDMSNLWATKSSV